MNHPNDKHPQFERTVAEALNGEVPPEAAARLRGRLMAFRERLDMRDAEAARRPPRRFGPRLAWAGGMGLALLVVATLLMLTSTSTPTWAGVVQSFGRVGFFSATIYLREDALARPEQFELWSTAIGRARIHRGQHVFFALPDGNIRGFDVERCREIDVASDEGRQAERMARKVVQLLATSKSEFSLQTVLAALPGELTAAEAVLNPEAELAADLAVFDLISSRTPEWARIWVLRESQLPVRIVVWDPRDGEQIDVAFAYTTPQPVEFFDPEAFAAGLSRDKSRAARVYGLMRDPGGRTLTSEELYERRGYHMPEVREAGIAPNGIVWVVAGRSRNLSPGGDVFDGFERLTDQTGRGYWRAGAFHRTAEDVSIDFFVPFDFGQAVTPPEVMILTAGYQHYRPDIPFEPIGTVEWTDFARDAWWPEAYSDYKSFDWDPRLQLAYHLFTQEEWMAMEALLAQIDGEPEDSPKALRREAIRFYADYKRWRGTNPLQEEGMNDLLARARRLTPLDIAWAKAEQQSLSLMLFSRMLSLIFYEAGWSSDPQVRKEGFRKAQDEVRALFQSAGPELIAEHDRMPLASKLSWDFKLEVPEINRLLGTEIIPGKTRNEFHGAGGWWSPEMN